MAEIRRRLGLADAQPANGLLGTACRNLDRSRSQSDGSLLVLPVSDVRLYGERLEGRGVMPDVAVPFPLPYAAGRDPQLDTALAELAHGT